MNWAEVQIKTTPKYEELISSILYDVGATGLAIEDPRDILELSQSPESWAFIDPDLINVESDDIVIKAYFSEAEDLDYIVQEIKYKIRNNPILKEAQPEVTVTMVDDEDFAQNWKKYYKPTKIGERIVIKPTWEAYTPEEGDILVELDPGMAFGTGTHETTILCTEALERYVKQGDIVYDIGCGSGILSIVAAKLGAEKVVGVDLDEVCIKVSNENIIINQVEDIIEVKKGNLLDVVEGKANIIVSNIIAEIIVEMIGDLKSHLEDKGIFITSGIIEEKIPMVEKALLENGFKILETKQKNEWALILAKND
ncbi:MAG: 50S ribosomal protein L11 methyltransferase [Tissierellia bacterium]|nr:50S ribosomal protein L11 methyltransferase [Tissierellia bacterium]